MFDRLNRMSRMRFHAWLLLPSLLCGAAAHAQFLPENARRIPVQQKKVPLTDASFERELGESSVPPGEFARGNEESLARARLSAFQETVKPLFDSRGWTLTVELLWESAVVNAQATRDANRQPVIRVHGGLLRHPLVVNQADGLLAILCHEAGHFLGGAPKQLRGSTQLRSWTSAEGQADYFATTKCLRRLFQPAGASRLAAAESIAASSVAAPPPAGVPPLPPALESSCERAAEPAVCMRSLQASQLATWIYADVIGTAPPRLDRPDLEVVGSTVLAHPRLQCRLDTLAAGAFCSASDDDAFDDENPSPGSCARIRTPEEPWLTGARPACWFVD
ncbi:MAG: hypothetical protein IT285_12935 [Bdellovibrionales bacterium]|nr:hypothetical protein [Bdellovibrionales bacterium]